MKIINILKTPAIHAATLSAFLLSACGGQVGQPSDPDAPGFELPSDPSVVSPTGACGRYIADNGSGSGELRSDPGSIRDINQFIEDVGPGGTVCLQPGTYGTDIDIIAGGSDSAPVVIRGEGGYATFASDFDASTRAKSGDTVFTIEADHLFFENLKFSDVGTCFRFATDVNDVTLHRFKATGVATCVNVVRYGSQLVDNLTISQAMITQFTRSGVMLAANVRGALIVDSYLDMQPDRIGGQGSDYVTGISIYDSASEIEIRNTTVMNVIGKTEGYTQGDGIDAEATASNITVTDSYFRGNQDGCIDAKAKSFSIYNTVAIGCKRNFRLWQNDTPYGPKCVSCISYDPIGDAHIFIEGSLSEAIEIEAYSTNEAKLCVTDSNGSLAVKKLTGSLPTLGLVTEEGMTADEVAIKVNGAYQVPAIPNPTPFQP